MLSLNQVVAMHSGRDCNLGKSSTHKLKDDHLSSSILTGNSVWSQIEVGLAADDFLFFWVVQVTVQYFFRVGQWSLETLLYDIDVI